jgi:recombination protein RecT
MSKGPTTNGTGQIQPRKSPAEIERSQKEHALAGLLQAMGPEIARAMPRHLTADRMARVSLTAIRVNPKLADCTSASFIAAIMACAQLGLEPNSPLGHAYLIPYNDRKRNAVVCQLILGYQGMIDLALRSGRVTSIKASIVREGDVFEVEHGLNEKLVHRPSGDDDAKMTHVYAVARVKDGDPIFTVLSKAAVEKRRKRGASGHGISTPWDTDYESMALKCAVRALWKWLPKSAEMATASIADGEERREPISYAMPEIADALKTAGLEEPPVIDVPADTREPGDDDEPEGSAFG